MHKEKRGKDTSAADTELKLTAPFRFGKNHAHTGSNNGRIRFTRKSWYNKATLQ